MSSIFLYLLLSSSNSIKKMKKKTYIEPSAEALALDLMALMAGSVTDINSEDVAPEVSGSNEPARAKETSLWDYEWE